MVAIVNEMKIFQKSIISKETFEFSLLHGTHKAKIKHTKKSLNISFVHRMYVHLYITYRTKFHTRCAPKMYHHPRSL